jgi:hypothetical protein
LVHAVVELVREVESGYRRQIDCGRPTKTAYETHVDVVRAASPLNIKFVSIGSFLPIKSEMLHANLQNSFVPTLVYIMPVVI